VIRRLTSIAAAAVLTTMATTAPATETQACEMRKVTDTARTVNLVPPRVAGDADLAGDADFAGHGPNVQVWVSLATHDGPRDPVGMDTLDGMSYLDTDHADDRFGPAFPNGFVSGYRFIGDTPGDEAGTETFVEVSIKPITLRLSRGCP